MGERQRKKGTIEKQFINRSKLLLVVLLGFVLNFHDSVCRLRNTTSGVSTDGTSFCVKGVRSEGSFTGDFGLFV